MSLRGQLLIASPTLTDPNFARSVVLIAEHGEEGAMGLVLNRPSDALVDEALNDLDVLVEDGAAVYVGGPVQAQAVMVLAEFEDPTRAAALVIEDVGFLPADSDLPEIATVVRRARVFAGHAGWGPGQLDDELEEGAWIVVEARGDDVFAEPAGAMWSAALERKGGPYKLLARIPEDPSLN